MEVQVEEFQIVCPDRFRIRYYLTNALQGLKKGWQGRPRGSWVVPTPASTAIRLYRVHFISVNRIIEPGCGSVEEGKVNCRERLGGLLRYEYHYRDAA